MLNFGWQNIISVVGQQIGNLGKPFRWEASKCLTNLGFVNEGIVATQNQPEMLSLACCSEYFRIVNEYSTKVV